VAADQQHVPLIAFAGGQRNDEVAAWHRARCADEEGVVFIGVAQEKASALRGRKLVETDGRLRFAFARTALAVNHYSFYLHDRERGPAFIKVGSSTCRTQCGCT
jgi:hypothetical protein